MNEIDESRLLNIAIRDARVFLKDRAIGIQCIMEVSAGILSWDFSIDHGRWDIYWISDNGDALRTALAECRLEVRRIAVLNNLGSLLNHIVCSIGQSAKNVHESIEMVYAEDGSAPAS